jgi:hypothetical protein
VGQDQSGSLVALDDRRHGVALAAASDAQQHLVLEATAESIDQLLDRLRLIPGRLERRLEAEIGHTASVARVTRR